MTKEVVVKSLESESSSPCSDVSHESLKLRFRSKSPTTSMKGVVIVQSVRNGRFWLVHFQFSIDTAHHWIQSLSDLYPSQLPCDWLPLLSTL